MRRAYTIFLFVVMASIDNTVLQLLPVLTPSIREALGVDNRALGLVIGLNLLVVAVTALFWGYRSDQTERKRLLIAGTLAWAVPVFGVTLIDSFGAFLALMLLAGLGLGCISTVGYSIITDLVPAHWRGLMLGVWGLAQGIGALLANVVVGLQPPGADWQAPFGAMAIAGFVCSALALFALSPPKGAADSTVAALIDRGGEYDYRIKRTDLPNVLNKPTNRWLMAQGFIAQFTFGALIWITALLTARLVSEGLQLGQANSIAALLGVLLQIGGIVSLYWGWLGDRLQQRNGRARALLAAYGFWVAIPFYLLLFWAPLPVVGQASGSAAGIVGAQLSSNVWWWLALLGATGGIVAQATNAPNWFAMVSEVNLPEHRGTAFSFVTLASNTGRALGAFLVSITFDWLLRTYPEPVNYALGLSLFLMFFIPAGLCFWLASRTAPRDAALVERTLRERAAPVLVPG